MLRRLALVVLIGCALWSAVRSADAAEPRRPLLRRPIALVLADGDRWLFVANRRAGTVSVIDTGARQVVDEVTVGRQLADLKATSDGSRLLALDEDAHELVVLARQGPVLTMAERFPVSPYPVSVAIAADGKTCFVASLWSRRLTIVDLAPREEQSQRVDAPHGPRATTVLDLPFAPREQLLVRGDTRLILADAFGGKLAVIHVPLRKLEAIRELPAHNIRGLAVDGEGRKLLVSHQIANRLAETNHNDVHWGVLLTNVLRWLVLDHVLAPDKKVLLESHVHPAGDPTGAGGDPAGVWVTDDQTVLLALAGVGKLAYGKESDYSFRRLEIGVRPTAVVADRQGRLAYVADTFDDCVVVADLTAGTRLAEIDLGPRPELTLADRGEMLFYDARLSLDGWYSCHSCHTDGHTCGLLIDNLGDDSFGAAKRILSLLGTADTGPWAWNGTVPGLETQIRKSIESTMQGDAPTDEQVQALAAFLHTLGPPPALGSLAADDPLAVARGGELFRQQGCATCHAPPEYTSPEAFDVGLSDQLGNGRFNPPSLRGVSQGGPYLHDNRAARLEEVFSLYGHKLQGDLSPQELSDLLAFLRSL